MRGQALGSFVRAHDCALRNQPEPSAQQIRGLQDVTFVLLQEDLIGGSSSPGRGAGRVAHKLSHCLLYWQSTSECWLESWLLGFWHSFLLMHSGKQWVELVKELGPCHPCGRDRWGYWLQPGPGSAVVAVRGMNQEWVISFSLCGSAFQINE